MNCLDMVAGGVRRLVREAARVRLVNPIMKEVASNPMVKEVASKGMSARSGSSSAQTILSAKREVGFKSVLFYLALNF